MLSFFSFVLMWLGSLNWFFISAFQYDFVAGFFGTQSSLFSRFIYFLIGMAGFVMLVMLFKNKGVLKLTENPLKKKKSPPKVQEISPEPEPVLPPAPVPEIAEVVPQKPSQTGYKDFDASKYDD